MTKIIKEFKMTQTLLVNRNDFADIALVSSDEALLNDGSIRVSIGPWALTANNITYMAVGDMIGYWKYFEPIYGRWRYDWILEIF